MHEPLDPLVDGSDHPLGIVGTIVENPADANRGLSWHGSSVRFGSHARFRSN